MLRIFIFLIIVLLLGFAFAWVADRPGDVTLQWQDNLYETSLMVVLAGLVALVATVMVIWWLARTVFDMPRLWQRFWVNRKRDRGYKALSGGLIAANSGDAVAARRFTNNSVKLLGHEPLVDLLDAQTTLLEGKQEEAKARFEEMLGDDDTKLVALRGLYLEAEKQGAREAAQHYAEEAHAAKPALPWAGNAMLRYRSLDGDWEGALAALEANRVAGLTSKQDAKRQKAVLLTAQAIAHEPADPARAAKLARQAHKLAPDLVPTAVIGSKALARNSDIGRAAGLIENVWKKSPHPDLAEAYVHLRIGDSATDRLKRARKLAAMRAHHREGNIAVAEAAIEAGEWQAARDAMKPVLSTAPSERACLIMADIEEGEHGDKGRMREWLSRAVRAPADAKWTADGYVSDKWLPVSPVTGLIDAFEWKVPVEQLGAAGAETLDAADLERLASEPLAVEEATEAVEIMPAKEEPAEADKDHKQPAEADGTDGKAVDDGETKPVVIEANEPATDDKSDASGDKTEDAVVDGVVDGAVDGGEAPGGGEDDNSGDEKAAIFPLKHRPDDPGVDKAAEEPKKRFGIF